MNQTREEQRLEESRSRQAHWKRWGPYLSERAWGTVREDYSAHGEAWEYLSHDQARSRAYRWNEDGLAGISDRRQRICFALALWNGRDPILKERVFGLTGNAGNHGEDVKEYYFYLDSTPTHSYMKYLYKYPQAAYPYGQLVEENRRRGKDEREFELIDTGVFADNRYFDVHVEYAKAACEDILARISVTNHGPEAAELDVLPTVWFRNTWSWRKNARKPVLRRETPASIALQAVHDEPRWLLCEGEPELLFTENETNSRRLYQHDNGQPYCKDGINDYVVHGAAGAVNPEQQGTKACARYRLRIEPGETRILRLRLTNVPPQGALDRVEFDRIFNLRRSEADEFYSTIVPGQLSADARNVMRQSLAGLLWSKQFYHYVVRDWLDGDETNPPPPSSRKNGRNKEWGHLYNADVISMPDKWEYPWYAAWDLACHCIPLALVDSDFAKGQLMLMVREWYLRPTGQLPPHECALVPVHPRVPPWAA